MIFADCTWIPSINMSHHRGPACNRVGLNRICTPYMAVCAVMFLLKIPCIHRIYVCMDVWMYGVGQHYAYFIFFFVTPLPVHVSSFYNSPSLASTRLHNQHILFSLIIDGGAAFTACTLFSLTSQPCYKFQQSAQLCPYMLQSLQMQPLEGPPPFQWRNIHNDVV
jgi:hypothetical protein